MLVLSSSFAQEYDDYYVGDDFYYGEDNSYSAEDGARKSSETVYNSESSESVFLHPEVALRYSADWGDGLWLENEAGAFRNSSGSTYMDFDQAREEGFDLVLSLWQEDRESYFDVGFRGFISIGGFDKADFSVNNTPIDITVPGNGFELEAGIGAISFIEVNRFFNPYAGFGLVFDLKTFDSDDDLSEDLSFGYWGTGVCVEAGVRIYALRLKHFGIAMDAGFLGDWLLECKGEVKYKRGTYDTTADIKPVITHGHLKYHVGVSLVF